MSRTTRHDNGLNKGRDDKPHDSRCEPSRNARGYDTFLDDHGHYGAGGHRTMKRLAARARRNHSKDVLRRELGEE